MWKMLEAMAEEKESETGKWRQLIKGASSQQLPLGVTIA